MNNKAKEHFAKVAIRNVFYDDPEYLCNRLFGGSWVAMYNHITDTMGDCASSTFPDPQWTDIATDWSNEDYDKRRIAVRERWTGYQIGYALQQEWEDGYYAVRYALKCGITLEDLE